MLLGIISDTHDQLARTVRAVNLLTEQGAEALIHCGDLVSVEILEACGVLPFWFVFGNNEDDFTGLRSTAAAVNATCLEFAGEVELGGKRIAVTHGHLSRDVRRLLAAKPDYLLSGHSHEAHHRMEDGVQRINPGAIYRAERYSVALLDLATDHLRYLDVPR